MLDVVAAFLIGAGTDSYFGSGLWISDTLEDVEQRWCPPLFERPLGEPISDAIKGVDGVYVRSFASGTNVTFDTNKNKGTINWGHA